MCPFGVFVMCKIFYSLQMSDNQPQIEVIEQLPENVLDNIVVYEIDDEIFPLKTTEETARYLKTLYNDPMHTKVLPGFITHTCKKI